MPFLEQLFRGYHPIQVIIELAVIWVFVYFVFRFLRGTRGAGVIKGFALLLIVLTLLIRVLSQASDAFGRIKFIYDSLLAVIAILLIVVFQPELRQAMTRLGQTRWLRIRATTLEGLVEPVSNAVEFLSKSQFGAIIAIERDTRLGGLVEGGIRLDAELNAALLKSIFWPNSPLHDLGVVIRGDRVVAASVQFPLVEEGHLDSQYGSRHRAAVGLSLEADCVVVIVSEESGNVSIAEHGQLETINRDEFADVLRTRLAAGPTKVETPGSDVTPAPDAVEGPVESGSEAVPKEA